MCINLCITFYTRSNVQSCQTSNNGFNAQIFRLLIIRRFKVWFATHANFEIMEHPSVTRFTQYECLRAWTCDSFKVWHSRSWMFESLTVCRNQRWKYEIFNNTSVWKCWTIETHESLKQSVAPNLGATICCPQLDCPKSVSILLASLPKARQQILSWIKQLLLSRGVGVGSWAGRLSQISLGAQQQSGKSCDFLGVP